MGVQVVQVVSTGNAGNLRRSVPSRVRVCQHGPVRRFLPGLLVVAGVTGASYLAHMIIPALSPLTAAVLVGLLVGNLLPIPGQAVVGVSFAAVRLLRAGVALLGAGVSVQAFAELGAQLLAGVLLSVAITIFGIVVLARVLGVDAELGLLIGVGYGICGASAVAATHSQTRASDEQASYAVALVALCGTLSIAVLPTLGVALGLGDGEFGRWVGAAVHDVGQVVATASTRGPAVLETAVVVKLARVALLAPVVLLISMRASRARASTGGARPPLLPAFVLVFLALAALRSADVLPGAVVAAGASSAKVLMVMGLAALGLQVRAADLRRLGGRPLALGLLAWVLVAGVALAIVKLIA